MNVALLFFFLTFECESEILSSFFDYGPKQKMGFEADSLSLFVVILSVFYVFW